MFGTESSLLKILGQVFLLITFFATVVVAIKVLMGGRSGSTPERGKALQGKAEPSHKDGKNNVKELQRQSTESAETPDDSV